MAENVMQTRKVHLIGVHITDRASLAASYWRLPGKNAHNREPFFKSTIVEL